MKVDSVNANNIIWDFGYGLGSSVHLGKMEAGFRPYRASANERK
ncbi:MAG: hypothetical protein U0X76_02205 [Bacteroidia bacterium]